jgi:hypothetical protein
VLVLMVALAFDKLHYCNSVASSGKCGCRLRLAEAVGAPCGGDRRGGVGGRADLPGRGGSVRGSAAGRSVAAWRCRVWVCFCAQIRDPRLGTDRLAGRSLIQQTCGAVLSDTAPQTATVRRSPQP